ncbi:hypothetical protein CcCBS67573_g08551 [Chytriomyces confervae]|uniref:NAD-dependent epimerase/dehydratase domain-containing protein n=1 Tax=Chytriomyces confervae TaxID=246404 RepID=A0A507EI17_9FUNG|nr:hypothetical protein CcCBS67573_g08551 [Chytriomyces confervae]
MAKVLVTGVSGYIGCHVSQHLLSLGFKVTGTVRSAAKAEQVRASLAALLQPAQRENLSFAIVDDIAVEGAFDSAVRDGGFEFVVHTASPFTYAIQDPQRDLIDPAVNGTTGVLKSVLKYGGSVKRIVVTSSMAAIRNTPTANPDGLSELDWNNAAIKAFNEMGAETPAGIAYSASKTLAEKAAWAFLEQNKCAFDLVTINPPFVFGPPIHPCSAPENLNTSVKLIWDMYVGAIKEVNPALAAGCVDVRDVARAHALALSNPEAGGQRFITSSGPYTQTLVRQVLQKRFPGRSYATGELAAVPVAELNAKSKRVLGMGEYIGLEESIVDTVNACIDRFGDVKSVL